VVPGLIQSMDHPPLLMNFVPILVLLVLWFVVFFFIRRRDRQKLRRELEELRTFETANRA
jgi:preprotein translocase subunit YajC